MSTSSSSAGGSRRRRRPLGGATARSSRSPARSMRSSARAGRGLVRLAAAALDVGGEAAEPGARDAAAEPRRRRLLEPVRLVEDDRVVVGQHAAAGREVGEVERVVRDHELGLPRARARGLGEAGAEERALPPRAAVGPDGELGPERLGRLDGELRAIAGLGLREPRLERLEGLLVARIAQQHRAEALQLLAAEVVLAPLEHGDAHLPPERARRGRHLVGEQLLLQRLRRRRDDDALPRLERRDQVAEALARARSRLGDQVLARRERLLDGPRERGLLGPRLEAGKRGGERAGRAECVAHSPRGYASERMFSRPAARNSPATDVNAARCGFSRRERPLTAPAAAG